MKGSNERGKNEMKFNNSQDNSADDFFYKRYARSKNGKSKGKLLTQMRHKAKMRIKKGKNFISVFLKQSSVYALNQIGNSNSIIRRIIWILVLFTGIVGFSYQIWQFLASYYNYPVVVNIYSVKSKYQEFPAVTVCNINSIREKFKSCFNDMINYDNCSLYTPAEDEEYNRDVARRNDDEDNNNGTGNKELQERISTEEFLETYNNTCGFGDWTFDEDSDYYWWRDLLYSVKYESIVRYGHQQSTLIRDMEFGKRYANFKITHSATFAYGNCYTFRQNPRSYRQPRDPLIGPDSGLELDLDIEIDEYFPFTEEVGARIHIHDPSQPHDVVMQGINIYPGYKTSIGMSKYSNERLPAPYPDKCKYYDIGDSESQCEERCDELQFISNCSCSMGKSIHSHIDICDINRGVVLCCLYSIWRSDYICDCPPGCNYVGYNLQISSAVWPSEASFKILKKKRDDIETNMTIEDFRKTRLKVKVYYDTLDYTVTSQNPMYRDSEFLSLVGGQLGLWLGLSLITMFEFLENLFILCSYQLN